MTNPLYRKRVMLLSFSKPSILTFLITLRLIAKHLKELMHMRSYNRTYTITEYGGFTRGLKTVSRIARKTFDALEHSS